MKKHFAILILLTNINYLAFSQLTPAGDVPSIEEFTLIYNKMQDAIKEVKTTKFKMIKNERFEGKIVESEQICKMQVNPRKIYMNLLKGPNSGTEILYVQGQNDGDAYASVGKWVPTVSIDPYGSLANDKQRHNMFQLGFGYTGEVIAHAFNQFKNDTPTKENYQYGGIIKWHNTDVYKITLTNLNYKILDYTVLAQEDLIKIAWKLKLDEYSILELNPSIDDYYDVKPGQVIKIPSSFSRSVIMYIDAKTYLPVYQKISDLKGMIGEYSYLDIQINPAMKADEFSKDFSEYGF